MELTELQNIYKTASFSDGMYLRDKSHKFDCIYFCASFINDYVKNKEFNLEENLSSLEEFLSQRFKIDINSSLVNYWSEPINFLETAKIIKRKAVNSRVFKIEKQDVLTFICERTENAYILLYVISYYVIKNAGCFKLYKDFCKSKDRDTKTAYVKKISKKINKVNKNAIKDDTNWAKQATKYLLENLNYINNQPHISRELAISNKKDRIAMISINISNPKKKTVKNNGYLKKFEDKYVKETLEPILVEGLE